MIKRLHQLTTRLGSSVVVFCAWPPILLYFGTTLAMIAGGICAYF